jgi:two-component system, chemotaxis family, chemotaxis protein CheY
MTTILIVDDSKIARMMVRKFIVATHPDWVLHEACNGEDAVAKVAEVTPDYIVLDFNMPGIDGLETAQRIKASGATAKIVMVTANIQEPVRRQAETLGIKFLNKPFREEALLAELTGAVAR